jgi:hypothetical protein
VAKQILGPASTFTVNANDLSQYVTNISIEDSRDAVDVTGLSETYREYITGLGDATVTVTFINDQTASPGPDITVYPLYANQTNGTIKFKANTAGTVVYTMVGRPYSWPPVSGGPGDANTIDVTFQNGGTAGLSRGTA